MAELAQRAFGAVRDKLADAVGVPAALRADRSAALDAHVVVADVVLAVVEVARRGAALLEPLEVSAGEAVH